MVKGNKVLIYTNGSIPGTALVTTPIIDILLPDATTVSATAIVEVNRKLSYDLDFDKAGVYDIEWSAVYDTGKFSERVSIPVTYLDIRKIVIAETRMKESTIDVLLFDQLLSGQIKYWLGMLSDTIPDYNAMSISDGIIFDTAMSIVMSCYLRPYISKSGLTTGELSAIGTGPDRIEYHRRYAQVSLDKSDEDCLDRAWLMLRAIKSIAEADYQCALDEPFFQAAGQRRKLRSRLGLNNTENPLYNIRTDEVLSYMFNGGYLNGLVGGTL